MNRLQETMVEAIVPNQDARVVHKNFMKSRATNPDREVPVSKAKDTSLAHGVNVTDIDTWRSRNNAKPVVVTRTKVAA